MSIHSSFAALGFLTGGSTSFACGTWFFIDGEHLPYQLRGKTRSVVASRDASDGGVIVYPRSASRKVGEIHDPHAGHECKVTMVHESLRLQYNSHSCHINKPGWVDPQTPITLALDITDGCFMCFEDESSPLLAFLEDGPT